MGGVARAVFGFSSLIIATGAYAVGCELLQPLPEGISVSVPPGYEATNLNSAVSARWPAGPWATLEVAVVYREGPVADVWLQARLWAAAAGAAAAEVTPLAEADLKRAGADEGVRVKTNAEERGGLRVKESIILARGAGRYRVTVSYAAADAAVAAVADDVLRSVLITPATARAGAVREE